MMSKGVSGFQWVKELDASNPALKEDFQVAEVHSPFCGSQYYSQPWSQKKSCSSKVLQTNNCGFSFTSNRIACYVECWCFDSTYSCSTLVLIISLLQNILPWQTDLCGRVSQWFLWWGHQRKNIIQKIAVAWVCLSSLWGQVCLCIGASRLQNTQCRV